ncbi:Hypothetical predicted protein [Marmota monax]|uniref:Uncharacterized protein n=1 Tax=Marmota monax TaxID=9995 RepID=A0A5E4A299_MARMO|nr:Hypothetical predicted protein [Marmota monax]
MALQATHPLQRHSQEASGWGRGFGTCRDVTLSLKDGPSGCSRAALSRVWELLGGAARPRPRPRVAGWLLRSWPLQRGQGGLRGAGTAQGAPRGPAALRAPDPRGRPAHPRAVPLPGLALQEHAPGPWPRHALPQASAVLTLSQRGGQAPRPHLALAFPCAPLCPAAATSPGLRSGVQPLGLQPRPSPLSCCVPLYRPRA